MTRIDLHHVDLNLLVIFDMMMLERNVTKAAGRLSVGQPEVRDALARLQSLCNDGEELSELPEMHWLNEQIPGACFQIRVSSVTTLVHACETGLGLALLPCILAERNGLRRLSTHAELHREVWLLSHRDAGGIGRYRAVADWLKSVFEFDSGRLRGENVIPAPPL